MSEPEWTAADQARADTFTEQIVSIAGTLRGGHPDAICVAFVQTTGRLMRERLRVDPSRAAFFARMIDMLKEYVQTAAAPSERAH